MKKRAVNKQTTIREIPGLVKIISVLSFIAGIVLVLFGISSIIFVNSSFYENYAGFFFGRLGGLPLGSLYLVIIFFIAVGIFSILVGRGLWNGKNWARICKIILSLIWAMLAISGASAKPVWSTFSVVLNLLIAYYLLFNLKVKAVFLK